MVSEQSNTFSTDWFLSVDTGKRSASASSTKIIDSVENLYSGKYFPKGVQSSAHASLVNEMKINKAVIIRISFNKHMYTVKLNAKKGPLHDFFKAQVNKIGNHLDANNTDEARYEAESLIEDYGTHFTTQLGYGAKLSLDIYLTYSYWNETKFDAQFVSELGKRYFFEYFKLPNDYATLNTNLTYTSFALNVIKTTSTSIGMSASPPEGVQSINAWLAKIPSAKAVILRKENILSDIILTHDDLRTLKKRSEVKSLLEEILRKYATTNAHEGCLDRRWIKYGTSYATYQPNEEICHEDIEFGGTYANTYHCSNQACGGTTMPCNMNENHISQNARACPSGCVMFFFLLLFLFFHHPPLWSLFVVITIGI
jgi:hypothetical protein